MQETVGTQGMGLEVGSGSCWQLSAAGERKDLEIPGTGLGRDLRCDEHTDIVVLFLTVQILAGSCILSLSHQIPVTTLLCAQVRELHGDLAFYILR